MLVHGAGRGSPLISGFRGRILHVTSTKPPDWQYLEDGVLLVENDRILDLASADALAAKGFDLSRCRNCPEDLIVPGFIDAHVHAPQIDVIGALGEHLLAWLDRYTFPAEARYADRDYAAAAAEDFFDLLVQAGTTSAMVYATSHHDATDSLFAAADRRRLRMVSGMVLMDQHAPPELLRDAAEAIAETESLIRAWHRRGRLGYAVTPRFAGTCSPALLAAAGQLHQAYPDTWVQTHLAENLQEVKQVLDLHPQSADYLGIYEAHGLVTDRTLLGHCIYLSDDEVRRLGQSGAVAVFCPSANLYLGSGLFPFQKLNDRQVGMGIGSDVGAGTSLSLLRTLGDAYKVCQMTDFTLDPRQAFTLATLGNAEALQLDEFVGNFEIGKEADFLILNAGSNALLDRRLRQVATIEEEIGLYMTLGDERSVAETWVAGRQAYCRDGTSSSG